MNKIIFDKILHSGRLHGLFRRGMALTLAAAMVLPMTSAMAATEGLRSLMHKADAPYPDVEIEGNFVRDEFGFFTGYFELGLRVKTPEDKRFQSLGVTLEYDASLLTPVDWETAGKGIAIEGSRYYTVDLPTQQSDKIDTAAARGGNPATPAEGISEGLKDGNRKVLTFTARSYEMVEFATMTTIAAVRFKVKDTFLDKLKITKRGTDDYDISYDGVEVTDVASLQAAMTPTNGPAVPVLMGFPCDADTFFTGSDIKMALDYHLWDKADGGNHYEYYFIPDYKYLPDDDKTYTEETQTIGDKKYTLRKPITKNGVVLAVEPTIDESANTGETGMEGKYSYLSNLIQDVTGSADPNQNHTYITFPIVSKRSFMDTEDKLGNLTTIVYVDWDNTLLGTQVVPKNTDTQTFDLRGMVSDYVADQFIYHTDTAAYSSNNLNSPTTVAEVASLERKASYRGKYPATEPAPDGMTDPTKDSTLVDYIESEPNGGEFPLTNKLDYVFYKRPMERAGEELKPDASKFVTAEYPKGEDNPEYQKAYTLWQNTWVQKPETSTSGAPGGTGVVASYDVEHPFAYGWAKCTVDNYEDVWTTLGVGELGDEDYGFNGASFGGYQAIPDSELATVTYIGTENFEYADLQKGFTESTVFLKAIYEPGVDLISTDFPYRMISKPYYNKLNNLEASAGGAYSIDVTYERASTKNPDSDNLLRGVARMRDPVVRQDTTPDLLWEDNDDLNVKHNLPSASNDDAYYSKSKSFFTKVEVANTDVISFSMALVARQNKVDYNLRDAYNYNFVAGGERSEGDANRSGAEVTMDNYNYFVDGQSDEADVWYDAPYDKREGSRGFVLTGTLNQLMELATQYNNDEVTDIEVSRYATAANLADINLTLAGGATPSTTTELKTIRDAMYAAAKEAEDDHYGEAGYWNNDPAHNCAQLTYHQIQLYIMGKGLLSPEQAENETIGWCHLHKDCVASVSNRPTTWGELIDAARNHPEYIMDLTGTEAESLAHLRRDINGTAYGSDLTAFRDDVVAAVSALDTAGGSSTIWSWDQIQATILGQDPADAADNYWWYDGSTNVFFNNWNDLMAAAKDAAIPVTLPDQSVSLRAAKLNRLKSTWQANDAVADDATDTAWVRATENLCITIDEEEGQKFTSFEAFKNELVGALQNLPDGVNSSWYQVQYYILHHSAPDPSGEAEYANYWWHNGGIQIKTFKDLMTAVDLANGGDPASLNSLDATLLNKILRKDFRGTEFDSTDVEDVKNILKKIVFDKGSTYTFEATQFYLIHGDYFDVVSSSYYADLEAGYYWWKDGGTVQAVTFDGTDLDKLASKFRDAAYRKLYNGNDDAWRMLTSDIIETARLISNDDGSTTFDKLPEYTVAEFESAVEALVNTAFSGNTDLVPLFDDTFTWLQLQHYFLTSELKTDRELSSDKTLNYWWKTEDNKPAEKAEPAEDFAELQTRLANAVATSDFTDFHSWLTADIMNNMGFVDENGGEFTDDYLAMYPWDWFSYDMCEDDSGNFKITWYQIQYAYINYGYGFDEASLAESEVTAYGYAPPSDIAAMGANIMLSLRAPVDPVAELTDQIKQLTEAIQEEPALAQEYAQQIADLLAAVDALKEQLVAQGSPLPAETPEATESLVPTESVAPVESAEPTESTEPTESPAPTESAEPSESPAPTETTDPEETEEPTEPPAPSESTEPTESPAPTESGAPSETLDPTEDPEPTQSTEPSGDTNGGADETDHSSGNTDDGKEKPGSAEDVSPGQKADETTSTDPDTRNDDNCSGPDIISSSYLTKMRSGILSTRIVAKAPPNLRSPDSTSRIWLTQTKILAIGRIPT